MRRFRIAGIFAPDTAIKAMEFACNRPLGLMTPLRRRFPAEGSCRWGLDRLPAGETLRAFSFSCVSAGGKVPAGRACL